MTQQKAIVLTNGLLHTEFAKTSHGLLRGSERFKVVAVIDSVHAGMDAGVVMDGKALQIPILGSVAEFLESPLPEARECVVGVAFPGGKLPETIREEIGFAIRQQMNITCGLHTLLGDDPEFSGPAKEYGVTLTDIRRPKPTKDLPFWSGAINNVSTPKIAVLGIDCAVGKRTTCRFLRDACAREGLKAEMIYTGQTGWMQGYRHGFILDATLNDFISGEIERVIVECDRDAQPDLMLIEGQSGLRNPAGPCGSEFILSGNIKGVILQHIPGRDNYDETNVPLGSLEAEVELIRFYGAEVLAITLNNFHLKGAELEACGREIEARLNIPVVLPLEHGVERLIPLIKVFVKKSRIPAFKPE